MTIKLRCRFGFHPWDLWSEPKSEKVIYRYHLTGDRSEGYQTYQHRKCPGCGKMQKHVLPT